MRRVYFQHALIWFVFSIKEVWTGPAFQVSITVVYRFFFRGDLMRIFFLGDVKNLTSYFKRFEWILQICHAKTGKFVMLLYKICHVLKRKLPCSVENCHAAASNCHAFDPDPTYLRASNLCWGSLFFYITTRRIWIAKHKLNGLPVLWKKIDMPQYEHWLKV